MENGNQFKIYDFMFPGSQTAKLVKVQCLDDYTYFPFIDIFKRTGIPICSPVVNLIGARENNRGKFFAGLTRACFNSDAVIIDNGIFSGCEKQAQRKGLKLIGIAPENDIQFPKVNQNQFNQNELSKGHTQFFLLTDCQWSQEVLFKLLLALKIAQGNLNKNPNHQKIVNILLGDSDQYIEEVRLAVEFDQVVLIVPGSLICNRLIKEANGTIQQRQSQIDDEYIDKIMGNNR
ncbi:hypothetical protein IMG5_205830 [Ichthyophthirius multifiliis]|uniref:LSDAT prokaryote domain-containing protein n=1 Tax=Ichthyophthirius multifiliis TaxID=5932 RepID=G0R6K4_ICHMU|nr:hypothetical protein IMG5_205830 [Ichthyophthirius multifiliis]EGR26903.1 hypothetical protein IMG5_205830 [Ichthyophthirius multifiliis]|eukprot:XP_004023787.1 hypothetical protein IMG5_205830 [Ichthyophthirius multifiliis]